MRTGVAALVAAAVVSGAAPAAAAGPAKVTYNDRFTTTTPGTSSGRLFSDAFADPADPQAKPPAVAHFRLDLPPGARFDTSAIPDCGATDAQLMAQGASACATGSRIGGEVFTADTGLDQNRYITADVDFLNEKDGLIILSRDRQSGARVVTHGKVGPSSEDIDVPMLPGTPPDGGVDKRENATFTAAAGPGGAYLKTPPECPAVGYWILRATYTFRDGNVQTLESRSPCTTARQSTTRRVAFFHRQHARAGHRGALRLRAAAAGDVLLEIRRGARTLLHRRLSLPAGGSRVSLPPLARGTYRLTLSSSDGHWSRSATLAVR